MPDDAGTPRKAIQPERWIHQAIQLSEHLQPVFLLIPEKGIEFNPPYGIAFHIQFTGQPAGGKQPDTARMHGIFQRHARHAFIQLQLPDHQFIQHNLHRPELVRLRNRRPIGLCRRRKPMQFD